MKTNPNEPANPFFKWNEVGYGDTITIYDSSGSKQFLPYESGLTKREYFAAMAMQALLSNAESRKPYLYDIYDVVTKAAVIYADNLINDLNKDDENTKAKL
jgi:hypothetical protein